MVSTIELLLLVLIPLLVVLPTIALINLLRHQFTGNDKLIWLLVILLLPVVGPVLYFAKGGKNKISEEDC